jgi:hypothetical protein
MARVQVDSLIFLGGRRWKKGVYENFPEGLVDSLPRSAVVLESGQKPLSDADFRAAAVARSDRRAQLAVQEARMRRAAEAEVQANLAEKLAKLYSDEAADPQAQADAKRAVEDQAVKELTEKKRTKKSGSVKLSTPQESSAETAALSDD